MPCGTHRPLLIGLIGLAGYLYLLIPLAGFFIGSLVYTFGVIVTLRWRSQRLKRFGYGRCIRAKRAMAGAIRYLFAEVLNMHLPPAILVSI